MPRRARGRPIALLLLVTQVGACSTWHVSNVAPVELLAGNAPPRVLITRPDSSTLVLDGPALVGDSLVGQSRGQRTSVANSDVAHVAVRKKDAVLTMALIGGITGALLIAAEAGCTGYC
jgi:hypothetical protein